MKSYWVVLGIAGALGLLAIADRSNTPSPISQNGLQAPAPYVPLTFKGYECTVDCSGHEAGYQWAEEQGIDDPDDCDGNSGSFIEGCRAYAEEQQGVSRSDDDDDAEDSEDDL